MVLKPPAAARQKRNPVRRSVMEAGGVMGCNGTPPLDVHLDQILFPIQSLSEFGLRNQYASPAVGILRVSCATHLRTVDEHAPGREALSRDMVQVAHGLSGVL